MEVVAQFNGEDGCWNWPKSKNVQTGYGQFIVRRDGKTKVMTAHRFSFNLFNGGIPDGMSVLHRCDNRQCCNPAHLFSGTQLENIQDMVGKGRGSRGRVELLSGDNHWAKRMPERIPTGSRHYAAKLTEAIVREARASSATHRELAEKYGVSTSTMCDARNGDTWRKA